MGRSSKLTPELQVKITKMLSKGYTDADVCHAVNIGTSTFYLWLNIGQACIDGQRHERKPDNPDDQTRFVDFVEAVTRARSKASQRAVDAFRTGLATTQVVQEETETFTETRLDSQGKPYDYTRTTTRKRIIKNPPDWRAGEAWLKRRDPDNWTGKENVSISGTLTWEQIMRSENND